MRYVEWKYYLEIIRRAVSLLLLNYTLHKLKAFQTFSRCFSRHRYSLLILFNLKIHILSSKMNARSNFFFFLDLLVIGSSNMLVNYAYTKHSYIVQMHVYKLLLCYYSLRIYTLAPFRLLRLLVLVLRLFLTFVEFAWG